MTARAAVHLPQEQQWAAAAGYGGGQGVLVGLAESHPPMGGG